MADSDNTRVCPSVTRRKVLAESTAATTMLALDRSAAAASGVPPGNTVFDPALSLWREWKAAYLATAELCKKQQQLETLLAKTVGFPRAQVQLPVQDVAIPVTWRIGIQKLLGDVRTKAEADLAAHQARWDAEDRKIGYSVAKRQELAAANRERELLDTLTATPANSLAGIAGKLDAVLREGESCEECTEFPWPQVRSALADLVRMGQGPQSGFVMPGSDRRSYSRQRRKAVSL
jgi:hypothetical protein